MRSNVLIDRCLQIGSSGAYCNQRYLNRGTMGYQIKGKDFNPGNRTIYGYDPVGRVRSMRHYLNRQGIGDGVTFSFAYNPSSQIKSRTLNNDAYANTAHYDVERDYTVNGLNQYTSAGPASFTYDDAFVSYRFAI